MTLLERTRDLLDKSMKSGATLREIAQDWSEVDTEKRNHFEWLRKFTETNQKGAPVIDNPGVKTVQSLHDFLKTSKRRRVA